MSDDRDIADPASDGTEDNGADTRGGQTAVVTPQRPTGKRSRQRGLVTTGADGDTADVDSDEAGQSAGKGAKTPKRAKAGAKKGSSGFTNPFTFVWNYLALVIAELRKVIWPNRKQMVSYTTVVLVFLVFMVTLIGLVDLGLAKLVLMVFG